MLHGDTKSTKEGNYHIRTMKDSNGAFIAGIMGAPNSSPVTIAAAGAAGAAKPSLQEVVDALKAKFS